MPDYPIDTPYTTGYYEALSPVVLAYVGRLAGVRSAPRLDAPFRYLELGCGNGLTTTMLAAAHPHAQFVGVDLNARHVANARALAAAGRVDNVTFVTASFADLDDAGPFDFIGFHGVYSWVGDEVRKDLRRVIDRALAPHGLVYCSYNAMPGWAPLLPVRTILRAYAASIPNSLERAEHGRRYLKFLADNGAAFFADNPAARKAVTHILGADLPYVVHEYFPDHFRPFYVSEVAEELAEIGLAFAGSTDLAMNHPKLAVPEQFRDVLANAPDRVAFETHKSFVLNERFRRDVFARATAIEARSDAEIDGWNDVLFGAIVSREAVTRTFKAPAGQVELVAPVYELLSEMLLERARTFGEIRAHPAFREDPRRTLDALHILCANGQFAPLLSPPRPIPPPGTAARFSLPIHRTILEQRGGETLGWVHFPSRVHGRATTLPALAAVAAVGIDGGIAYERLGAFLLDWIEVHRIDVTEDGKIVTGEARLRVINEALRAFHATVVPHLFRLGILEPA